MQEIVHSESRLASDCAPGLRFVDTSFGRTAIAALLFLIAAALRLPFLGADPPAYRLTDSGAFATDEGNWSYVAKEWAEGRNPLGTSSFLPGNQALAYTVPQYFSFKFLGVSLESARIANALLGSLTPAVIFLIGRRALGAGPAILVALLMAGNYWLAMYQRTALSDGWMTSWAALAFIAWESAVASRSVRAGIGAGILTALAIWSKISALPLLMAIVLAGGLLWIKASDRARIQAVLVGFLSGLLTIGLIAVFVYTAWPELAHSAAKSYQLVSPQPAADARTIVGDIYEAVFRTPTLYFMPVLTFLAYGSIVVAGAGLVRARRFPISLCAVFWVPLVYLMLVIQGYEPPRFYLQLVPAITVLAVVSCCGLWNAFPSGAALRRGVRIGLVLFVGLGLGLSIFRVGTWIAELEYTQRDIGRAIAKELESDSSESIVGGSWSHNLALSGPFRSTGAVKHHRRYIEKVISNGATHFLSAGPITPNDREKFAAKGLVLEELETFTYLRNYFEPRDDIHFYRLVPD